MSRHNLLGMEGEDAACRYLQEKGYRIVERNWHSGHKELDIVALIGNCLVIVEVKTRSNEEYQEPWDAVTPVKMRRIAQAAHHYVCLKSIDLSVRFDIVSLVKNEDEWEIEHFEDAFPVPPLFA